MYLLYSQRYAYCKVKLTVVEPGYNIGMYDISSIALDILWYKSFTGNDNIILLGYNDTRL
jgi:hypothetical protein